MLQRFFFQYIYSSAIEKLMSLLTIYPARLQLGWYFYLVLGSYLRIYTEDTYSRYLGIAIPFVFAKD